MKSLNFDKKKLKVVIFDFDDTIYHISSWKNWGTYVKGMLKTILGGEKQAQEFVLRHGISFGASGQQVAIALINEFGSAEKMCDYLKEYKFDIWKDTVISHLSNEDFKPLIGKYKLYILSNGHREYVLHHLDKMGIDARIFKGVYNNAFKPENPTKQVMYGQILKQEKIKPEEAVMVGDSYANDIVPAVTMGMQGVWITGPNDVRAFISELN